MSAIVAVAQRLRRKRDGTVLHVPGTFNFQTRTGRLLTGAFSRGGGAWDGTQVLGANIPRRATYAGGEVLLIEGGRTNLIRNSALDRTGDTVLPKNWGIQVSGSGVTSAVRGYVTENGVLMLEFSITTTANGAAQWAHLYLDSRTTNGIASASGKVYSMGVTLRRVSTSPASDTAGHTVVAGYHAWDSAGAYLNEPNGTTVTTKTTTSRLTAVAVTVTNSSTAFITPRITLTYPTTDAGTHIYRVAMPQCEEATYPSSYIPTTSVAVSRGSETWQFNSLAPLISTGRPFTLRAAGLRPANINQYGSGLGFRDATTDNLLTLTRYNVASGYPLLNVKFAAGATQYPGPSSASGVGIGRWQLMTVAYDGSTLTLSSGSYSSTLKTPLGAMTIGNISGSQSDWWGLGAPLLDIPFIRPWVMSAADIAAEDARWLTALNAAVLPVGL